jgi:predicted nucleotidyltransferase
VNFAAAVQMLSDAGVEFIIIGGWSAILHGSAHITNDLDLFFSRKAENLRRLAQALAPYHPRLRDIPEGLPFVWDEATLRSATILTLTTDLGMIDLLAEVTGLGPFEEVNAKSVTVEAFGRKVKTLDLKNLIKAKLAMSRDKDISVVRELESLLEAEGPES